MSIKPKKQTALVTGVSSGIGREIAGLLAARGVQVFGTVRNLRTVVPIHGVKMVKMDVTDDDSVNEAVHDVIQEAGSIQILVNNAGYGLVGAIEETSLDEARQQFETNFFGLLRVTHAVLPMMREDGHGRIANISSVVGFIPSPFMGLYSASKHAVEGYTETLDHEVRQFGVRAILIEPAFTKTHMSQNEKITQKTLPAYTEQRQRMQDVVSGGIANGDAPQLVSKAVWKAVTARSPKLRYPVGQGILISRLRRFAPIAIFDREIRKLSKLG